MYTVHTSRSGNAQIRYRASAELLRSLSTWDAASKTALESWKRAEACWRKAEESARLATGGRHSHLN